MIAPIDETITTAQKVKINTFVVLLVRKDIMGLNPLRIVITINAMAIHIAR